MDETSTRDGRSVVTSQSLRSKKIRGNSEDNMIKTQTLMRYDNKRLVNSSDVLSKIDGLRMANQYLKGTFFINPTILADIPGYSSSRREFSNFNLENGNIFNNFPFFAHTDGVESLPKLPEGNRKPPSVLVSLENSKAH